jgi:hypothetical protein
VPSLIRLILWLGKRDWGLSFLLALASSILLLAISVHWPYGPVEALWVGPVFRAGFYLGTITFPNYTIRGTNGFYLVPLFGVAANLLVLMALWFVGIRVLRELRGAKHPTNLPQP